MTKKRHVFPVITIFLFSFVLSACVHSDGSYKGEVIELETGEPIEGVVVAARWTILTFAHTERVCDATETITDRNGEFELPRGSCKSHPLARLSIANVVVFKPGYLAYPPIGASPEDRRAQMPNFTGDEFRNTSQYYIIRLGKPQTIEERELTYGRTGFSDDETRRKLPILLRLLNEERKNLGLRGELR